MIRIGAGGVRRRAARAAFWIGLVCWLAAAWAGAGHAAELGREAFRRELVVVVPEDAVSSDPARFSRHEVTEILQSLLYRRLLTKQGTQYGFDLARSVEVIDPHTWRIAVAADERTAEGRRLTAQEIARHFERLLGEPSAEGHGMPGRARLEAVASVEAQGDEYLVFRLSRPWPLLLAALTREPVALVGPDGQPVPTGPFRIERWERGSRIVLRRVAPAGEGQPTHIRVEVVSSAEERLRRVLSGEAHVAVSLPPDAIARLRASQRAKAVGVPQSRVHFVEFDVTRPPFDDARVRLAFNMAVDMESLVKALRGEAGMRAATLVSPVTLGYDPAVEPIRYDPAGARRLLAEAGYPLGFEFELDAPAAKRREAEAIRDMLARVGVTAVVRIWPDWATLRQEILLGNRQAWLGEWGNSSMDPAGAIRPKLHSSGEANYGGYRDAALDLLLDEADSRLSPDERLAAYSAVQRYILEQAPMLFGYAACDVYAVDAELDWLPSADGLLGLDAARWRE